MFKKTITLVFQRHAAAVSYKLTN